MSLTQGQNGLNANFVQGQKSVRFWKSKQLVPATCGQEVEGKNFGFAFS